MLSLMSAVEAQASLGCADPSAFEGKTKLLGYESPVKGVAWQPGPMHMAVTGVWCYQIKDEAACNSAYVGQALREYLQHTQWTISDEISRRVLSGAP